MNLGVRKRSFSSAVRIGSDLKSHDAYPILKHVAGDIHLSYISLQICQQIRHESMSKRETPSEMSMRSEDDFLHARLERSITTARDALLTYQHADGHWLFQLESDATFPAEYVLMLHYLGETPERALEAKIGAYLRRTQGEGGGWPLLHGGAFDMSSSVKAYFALKMIGDSPDLPHMQRARDAIIARGGASRSNVFTRILLALYGVIDWRAVPTMPVEIMLLPKWFTFHISKLSSWARTVAVPLLVVLAKRPCAQNPKSVEIEELFVGSPRDVGPISRAPHQSQGWFTFFACVDALLRGLERYFSPRVRHRAIEEAVHFVAQRLNGENGLGGIFPAMVNTVMMYDTLGYTPDEPDRTIARQAVERLLVIDDEEAYCQPSLSPVWDTAFTAHALIEAGDARSFERAVRGLDWLVPLQILDIRGDWVVRRAHARPGGWAFQFANPHYPDLDDTAVVAMALDKMERLHSMEDYRNAIDRASEWIVGMQSRNGGWGAYEPENTCRYLNNIPFSDHGALIDPPTADVSAHCLAFLAQLPATPERIAAALRAKHYILAEQEDDGSWYGHWGMNYVYGTWSALCALCAAGVDPHASSIQRAVQWLCSIQNPDGGWGEDDASYDLGYCGYQRATSTASQTSWALLGLMVAGHEQHQAVRRGVRYLLDTQNQSGLWDELRHTGVGYPRGVYLRYHGYPKYFPLWALARYRNLISQRAQVDSHGKCAPDPREQLRQEVGS